MVDTCQAATLFSQVCNLGHYWVMFLEISLTKITPDEIFFLRNFTYRFNGKSTF